MPAILCIFHTHYGYYTIAGLFDWYKSPAFLHLHLATTNLRLATYKLGYNGFHIATFFKSAPIYIYQSTTVTIL